MNSSTNAIVSLDKSASLAKSASPARGASPARSASPAELSDSDLLVATRLLVGRSNQLLASLLAHLAEVEARGVHRTRACSSLYTYCIYELRLSEDEAYRRVAAARLVRRFPALLEAVGRGELHLTGLLMLGPHLTNENLIEVLARAKHRTKKEIARLVRLLDPLPEVPSRIEPLGPAPARAMPRAPTWSQLVQSACPVRELNPGDRPSDWVVTAPSISPTPTTESEPQNANALDEAVSDTGQPTQPAPPAPAQTASAPARLIPQRFSVQFTASEEYVKLVEEAQALSGARIRLDELHLRAMRALVAELKRQKYAVTTRPRQRSASTPANPSDASCAEQRTTEPRTADPQTAAPRTADPRTAERPPSSAQPRRRGRYVTAEVRRAVFQRDGGRCTFTDSSGQRCRETDDIELHHESAFALGGEHTTSNLTLRCRAHNALAAEEDFGKEFIEQQRESDHERWTLVEAAERHRDDVGALDRA